MKITIHFIASILLVIAGAIHTFPALWKQWDSAMQQYPSMHYYIGAVGFTVGIANMVLLAYKMVTKK